MTVVLNSADKKIVKANNNTGRIYAKSIGTTTVTVAVKNASDEVLKTFDLTVNVKKNATALNVTGIEDGGKYALDSKLEVAIPAYEGGKKVDTDKRSLTCDDESVKIAENGRRKYTITFDKTGEFTIKAATFQSDTYSKPILEKEFKIKVTAPDYEVKQTAYNAFTVTFSNKDIAGKACEATKKSLTEGKADVTQTSQMIEVKQVGDKDEEISAFIGDVQQKENVLTIIMFSDLLEEKIYRVTYGDHDPVEFKAVKWIPDHMTNSYGYVPNMEEKGGTAKLYYKIFTVEGVDITGKVSQSGVIEYSDGAAKNEYDKYSVSGEQVDFYQDNVQAPVKAKFTWYGAADNKAIDLTNSFTVLAKDTRKYAVEYYLLGAAKATPTDCDKKREAKICVDEGVKTLNIRIAVDIDGDGVYGDDFDGSGNNNATDYIYRDDANVKFVTANADKLNVEKVGGATYAPKDANEVVGVYVYYKDVLVDADINKEGINPIPVTVYGQKTLTDLKVELANYTDGKFSYSQRTKQDGSAAAWSDTSLTYPIIGDHEDFKLKAVDQFGESYNNVKITIEKTTDVLDGAKGTVTLAASGAQMKKGDKYSFGENSNEVIASFTATSVDNAVRTVSYKATVEDLISKKTITKTFSFTVKNTTESTIVSQVVEGSDQNTKFHVYGKDSAGYKVCGYFIDSKTNVENSTYATSKVYVDIFRNADGSVQDAQTTRANDVTGTDAVGNAMNPNSLNSVLNFRTTYSVVGGGLKKLNANAAYVPNNVTSGSAITEAKLRAITQYENPTGSAITYLPSGSYSAKAYKLNKNDKLAILTATPFEYKPNIHLVDFTWKTAYSENTVVNSVLDDAFVFTTYRWGQDTDGTWKWFKDDENKKFSQLSKEIGISYVESENMITFLYAYTINPSDANNVIVETVINRSVYVGVSK